MSITHTEENVIISKRDILKSYEEGCKDRSNFKLGIEYERLLLDETTGHVIPYNGQNGIYRFLRQIAFKDEWSYITDMGQVVGLQKGNNSISLEPGGQFEISLAPQESVKDIKKEIDKLDSKILPIAKNLGIKLANYGISPISTYKNIGLIPKKRYEIMYNVLPGACHQNMMKETAGIQTTIDYSSEQDAVSRLRLCTMLSPIMTAIFANSPIYNGALSGYKSYRALSWLYTDNERCGLISEKLFEKNSNFGFNDYIDSVLDVPMVILKRNNQTIPIDRRITFAQYIKEGYNNYIATVDDFNLHANLYFPDVRLNSYIEMRNHDCQQGLLKYAIPAMYKGIFKTQNSINETLSILEKFCYDDCVIARENVPKHALDAYLGKYKIAELAQEVINIAYRSLTKEGKGEQDFLENIKFLVSNNCCPADVLIQKWNHGWNKNIIEFLEHISLTSF